MKQPYDFIQPQSPNHACRLKKLLYGLKQTPHAWFHHLSSFKVSRGFQCNKVGPSTFVCHKQSHILVLVLYIDNILLTNNNPALVYSFIATLSSHFAMMDLDGLHYFLGFHTIRTFSGLFLSKHKYVTDLLRKFQFHTLKSVCTQCASRLH